MHVRVGVGLDLAGRGPPAAEGDLEEALPPLFGLEGLLFAGDIAKVEEVNREAVRGIRGAIYLR